jgi:hypothetical protein
MKKLLIGAAAMLLITGTSFAQDKKKKDKPCKSDTTKACCKQPVKTAVLRTKAIKTKG